jgi:hypothetical protein
MIIAYIAHQISGDVNKNLLDLRRIIRKINLEFPDVVPFCPYYADIVSLYDNIPEERERGIKNDTEILNREFIDEMWLTGDKLSFGMQKEKEIAELRNIPVKDFINNF